ncbi:hypothetical protein OH687_14720 [Burkholderia anthina]|nr:hypothetical protein OH687_14720 [Burkholderia anthina]
MADVGDRQPDAYRGRDGSTVRAITRKALTGLEDDPPRRRLAAARSFRGA